MLQMMIKQVRGLPLPPLIRCLKAHAHKLALHLCSLTPTVPSCIPQPWLHSPPIPPKAIHSVAVSTVSELRAWGDQRLLQLLK